MPITSAGRLSSAIRRWPEHSYVQSFDAELKVQHNAVGDL